MQFFHQISPDLVFTREYLKAGVLVSLLSVWVLVGLFYYLNRYTRRKYFTIWTGAWLFYALWITLNFGALANRHEPLLMMLQQWCIGVSAILLLWGSLQFLGTQIRQSLLAWFIIFLFLWSYVGAYTLHNSLELELPVFLLIAVSSMVTSGSFLKYRRSHPYIGATLLTLGFFLWGVYMAGYPFLESSEDLTSLALFMSAGLQLMLAVSMIILVLEEARATQHDTQEKVQTGMVERQELQSRMAATERRYQKLFELASEAIIITDAADFRILEVNRAAERLLGLGRAELGVQSLTAYCQLKNQASPPPRNSGEWFQALCRQRPLNLLRNTGAIVHVEVNGAEVEFDGKPAYQFYLLELTERARLEQQLRQAEKLSAIGQMISGVAHELNNPLAVVKGYLELVLMHHDINPQTRADLEKAAHESNRAAKLVMNFLAFAREQPSHRELVKLNVLINRLVELRHFDLIVAKTEMLLELDPDLPMISADPDQIQQLIVNLMTNALQAMVELSDRGKMRIKTSFEGKLVRMSVEDNGPGVPTQLLHKIFEPFFTTKDVGTGTGLGLSIAHTLMIEHGGRIYYEKSSLGGAGFVLEFPEASSEISAVKEAPHSLTTEPAPIEPARSGRILVLDDEKAIAEMLAEMLDLLGYTPTICNLPIRALELIDQQDFDLIISDFRMPGMNGRQFFGLAVERKPQLASRIIFLTGDVVTEETQDFLKSTGNPHIAKPFNLTGIKTAVAQIMDSVESHQRRAEPAAVVESKQAISETRV